jgi:hypothetical protein
MVTFLFFFFLVGLGHWVMTQKDCFTTQLFVQVFHHVSPCPLVPYHGSLTQQEQEGTGEWNFLYSAMVSYLFIFVVVKGGLNPYENYILSKHEELMRHPLVRCFSTVLALHRLLLWWYHKFSVTQPVKFSFPIGFQSCSEN